MAKKINAYGESSTGKARKLNEDSFSFNTKRDINGSLFVVCDGVGGHKAGEVASNYTSKKFIEYFYKGKQKDILKRLKFTAKKVNKEIYQASQKDPSKQGMGTTLVAAFIFENKLYLANVGDSRAYFFRDNRLRKLTMDNSVVEKLLRSGKIKPSEVKGHPSRSHITRCIGSEEDVEVDTYVYNLVDGDRILLCSDGLWDELSNDEIEYIISESKGSKKTVNNLINRANDKGGKDNITATLINYGLAKVKNGSNRMATVPVLSIIIAVLAIALAFETFFIFSNLKQAEKENKGLQSRIIDLEKVNKSLKEELSVISREVPENKDGEESGIARENETYEEVSPENEEIIDLNVSKLKLSFPLLALGGEIKALKITPQGNIFLIDGENKLHYINDQGNKQEIEFEENSIKKILDFRIIYKEEYKETSKPYRIWLNTNAGFYEMGEGWFIIGGLESPESNIEIKAEHCHPKEGLTEKIGEDKKYFLFLLNDNLYSCYFSNEEGKLNIIEQNISFPLEGMKGFDLYNLEILKNESGQEIIILLFKGLTRENKVRIRVLSTEEGVIKEPCLNHNLEEDNIVMFNAGNPGYGNNVMHILFNNSETTYLEEYTFFLEGGGVNFQKKNRYNFDKKGAEKIYYFDLGKNKEKLYVLTSLDQKANNAIYEIDLDNGNK